MGPANKVSEVVARNMGSKSPPADAPAPRLQNWREPYRALPNAVLRSALFAVIGRKLLLHGHQHFFDAELVTAAPLALATF